jgi:hypothetical protein
MFGLIGGVYEIFLLTGAFIVSGMNEKVFYLSILSNLYQIEGDDGSESKKLDASVMPIISKKLESEQECKSNINILVKEETKFTEETKYTEEKLPSNIANEEIDFYRNELPPDYPKSEVLDSVEKTILKRQNYPYKYSDILFQKCLCRP